MLSCNGVGYNPTETDDYTVFVVNHDDIYGVTYGIENHSDSKKLIKMDMTESTDSYFTPWQGTFEKGMVLFILIYGREYSCLPRRKSQIMLLGM